MPQVVNLLRTVSLVLAGTIAWQLIVADPNISARQGGKVELKEQYSLGQTERLLISRVLVQKDDPTIFPFVFFSRLSEAASGTISLTKVEHGVATLSEDGQWVTFTPDKGYQGPAAIWFTSSETTMGDQPHALTILVADAPLVNLHFVQPPIRLDPATRVQLYIIGELADRQQGLLSPSALRFESSNPASATVSATGQVNGMAEGVGVVTATTQQLKAATAFAVGMPKGTDGYGLMLYAFGLDVAPKTLALVAQEGRQQLEVSHPVRRAGDGDLAGAKTGTAYYVSNPAVVSVSQEGLVTAGQEGTATITVANGPASTVVPEHVYRPKPAPATLDALGGIVMGANGAMVSVPSDTLHAATPIDITPLAPEKLSLPIPNPFVLLTAFRLDVGPGQLSQPIQVTLARPLTENSHRTVLFLRETSLPNKDGVEVPLWMQEGRGTIGPDHTIRIDAMQSRGVRFSGTYAVVVADPGQVGTVQGQVSYFFPVNPAGTFAIMASVGESSPIGGWIGAQGKFEMVLGVGAVTLKAVEVTPQGLVAESSTNIIVHPADKPLPPGRSSTGEISIQLITHYGLSDDKDTPWGAPEIVKGNLEKSESGAELILEGERFVFANERAPADKREGANPLEVMVNFQMPGRTAPFITKPLSGSTATQLRVRIPAGVILGLVEVSVTRPQWLRTVSGWDRRIQVTGKEESLKGDPHYYFVSDDESHVGVLDIKTHQLIKRIHTGEASSRSRPRGVIITGKGERAYVALQNGRSVAVIDTELFEEVDLIPETPAIDGLPFEDGEPNGMLWCCHERQHERLYVSDRRSGRIAVYDVSPGSETFHQRLAWINVDPAPDGLRDMAVNRSRNRLYVVAPGNTGVKGGRNSGHILVVDINPDSSTYNKQIARLDVDGMPGAIDAWAYGSGPIVFTTETTVGTSVGVIQDDAEPPPTAISYVKIGPFRGMPKSRVMVGTGVKVIRGTGVTVIPFVETSTWQTKPYVVVTYGSAAGSLRSAGRFTKNEDAYEGRLSDSEVLGGVGIIEDLTGPNPRFMEITNVTRGSAPFLASDQYDETYVLDRQKRTVSRLDLGEIVSTMSSMSQPSRSSMPLHKRNSKIIAYTFDTSGAPYGIASVGMIKIQLWIQ
ncbi:MAG: hypothetical protein E8D47_12170 [Nitrospira sp.]|nr:MAG: hypothetical protein E8D47_12170 [Nitrospira sp.]